MLLRTYKNTDGFCGQKSKTWYEHDKAYGKTQNTDFFLVQMSTFFSRDKRNANYLRHWKYRAAQQRKRHYE